MISFIWMWRILKVWTLPLSDVTNPVFSRSLLLFSAKIWKFGGNSLKFSAEFKNIRNNIFKFKWFWNLKFTFTYKMTQNFPWISKKILPSSELRDSKKTATKILTRIMIKIMKLNITPRKNYSVITLPSKVWQTCAEIQISNFNFLTYN